MKIQQILKRCQKVWSNVSSWVKEKYRKYISPSIQGDNSSYLVLLVSIAGIFLYVSTVMFHASYVKYFGISSDLVSFSVKNNIFFSQFWYLVLSSSYWRINTGLLFLFLVFLRFLYRKGWIFVLYIVTVLFLGTFAFKVVPWAGTFVAENNKTFYTIPQNCLVIDSYNNFIIPYTADNKVILLPVQVDDQGKYELQGGFAVRSMEDLSCLITREDNIVIKK
jgi:hypothetical protein